MESRAILSPDTLAVIVQQFGARVDGSIGGYSRFPLRHCNAVARTECGPEGTEPFEIEIVDLAMNGIGFRTHKPVASGTTLAVELSFPGIRPQIWRCRVVGIHAFDGGSYRMGARFQEIGDR